MFKWLFGARGSTAPKSGKGDTDQLKRFGEAHQKLIARGADLRKEYNRTLGDPVANASLEQHLEVFRGPEHFAGAIDAISAMTKENDEIGSILPLMTVAFMVMANETFASNSLFDNFGEWANAFSHNQKRELVRFAYIAAVWEQQQVGKENPFALAARLILMTLAANANEDATSQKTARALFSYMQRLKDAAK